MFFLVVRKLSDSTNYYEYHLFLKNKNSSITVFAKKLCDGFFFHEFTFRIFHDSFGGVEETNVYFLFDSKI